MVGEGGRDRSEWKKGEWGRGRGKCMGEQRKKERRIDNVEGGGRMTWRKEGVGVAYSILCQLSAQRDVFHVELYFKCLHKGQGLKVRV